MFERGNPVVVVKPEPGLHSALMAPYIGRALTFDRYESGKAFCQETGEVPLIAGWLQHLLPAEYVYGYDHARKRQIVFKLTKRMVDSIRRASETPEYLKGVHFRVYRDARDRTQVDTLPNPWPSTKDAEVITLSGGWLPGEVNMFLPKQKLLKPFSTLKDSVAKHFGTSMTTYENVRKALQEAKEEAVREQVPVFVTAQLSVTPAPPAKVEDTCNCSGRDLLWFGHKCGRKSNNAR